MILSLFSYWPGRTRHRPHLWDARTCRGACARADLWSERPGAI